jgi:glycosyltransferase involved in cell wall biosynthesis
MKKLVLGITSPRSTPLIEGQVRFFTDLGYDVYLLGPTGGLVEPFCEREGCVHVPIDIARDISPLNDIRALFQIIAALRSIRPDVVNFGTPKMGLLGSIAAWLLRVKRRVYTCRGLRYEHERGMLRTVLKATEWVSSVLSHYTVCVSPSVRDLGLADRVFRPDGTVVIGDGSSNGVDLRRFDRAQVSDERRLEVIRDLGLTDTFVVGFVGRLAERKGIRELYSAFKAVERKYPYVRLVLLGVLVKEQFRDAALLAAIEGDRNVHWLGFQEDVPLYMSVFDVLALPALWEGFPNVLLQAAAMNVPVVTTDSTGCRDAVSDGFNGTVVPTRDVDALAEALRRYARHPDIRLLHGMNGRSWASRFKPDIIWQGLHELYSRPS